MLASCGFDKKVIVWKETSSNNWEKVFEYNEHKHSVNSIAFASQEYGLMLLCGSSDGYISIHEYRNEQWNSKKHEAHSLGVNSVSWGPSFYPISFQNEQESNKRDSLAPLRFVTGGCDNLIRVWTMKVEEWKSGLSDSYSDNNKKFHVVDLNGHTDWVRDVAWLNYIGYAQDTIATCSEDQTVLIWTYDESNNKWNNSTLNKNFDAPTWKVSWSPCGTFLAVSTGENCVYLFRESVDGKWEEISQVNQDGSIDSPETN